MPPPSSAGMEAQSSSDPNSHSSDWLAAVLTSMSSKLTTTLVFRISSIYTFKLSRKSDLQFSTTEPDKRGRERGLLIGTRQDRKQRLISDKLILRSFPLLVPPAHVPVKISVTPISAFCCMCRVCGTYNKIRNSNG